LLLIQLHVVQIEFILTIYFEPYILDDFARESVLIQGSTSSIARISLVQVLDHIIWAPHSILILEHFKYPLWAPELIVLALCKWEIF
jgi:hypothetical protein